MDEFAAFLNEVKPEYRQAVQEINDYLIANECKPKIELAKSGYLVSYKNAKTKKVLLNFVFRKSGLITRIYGDNVNKYIDFVETLPASMQKEIDKAPVCKRLVNPESCNTKCSMGYSFSVNGKDHKKCKYNSFMFLVSDESIPFIKTFVENEIVQSVNTAL